MADRKITDLTALAAGSQATGDLLTIVDVSESAAADKNKKITMENLFKGIPGDVGINTSSPGRTLDVNGVIRSDGTSGRFELGGNSSTPSVGAAIHRPANNTLAFVTNSSERCRVDSAGRLLIGTSTARAVGGQSDPRLHIEGVGASANSWINLSRYVNSTGAPFIQFGKSRGATAGSYTVVQNGDSLGGLAFAGSDGTDLATYAAQITAQVDGTAGSNDMPGRLIFSTTADGANSPTERVRISSSGMVKIGAGSTITPDGDADDLVIDKGAADSGLSILSTTTGRIYFGDASGDDAGSIRYVHSDDSMRFETGSSERMRITSNGTTLIGATTSVDVGSSAHAELQVETPSNICASFYSTNGGVGPGGIIALGHARGSATGVLQDDDILGEIRFAGGDGNDLETIGAKITGEVDGNCGSNDMPSRLAFFTTPDASASPVERLRIDASGNVLFGKTSVSTTTAGFEYRDSSGDEHICMTNNRASGGEAAIFNRQASDGNLINFVQAGTVEGSISVSGTTVSYNGGHLSRWSQHEGNAERTEILRGTVLSNLDAMCDWGEEDNEQLNRMKISDVEGDPNVAGVFMCWDEDETYANDFYCSMTGDFIIRIAQGTTIARGDLLMSAGDGTAKPQDDDIVRSKTIAKVTSTTVSTTYADGSYCVPCVLMAC